MRPECPLESRAGVELGPGSTLSDSHIDHNGQLGIAMTGAGGWIIGNEISWNNYAGFETGRRAGRQKGANSGHLEKWLPGVWDRCQLQKRISSLSACPRRPHRSCFDGAALRSPLLSWEPFRIAVRIRWRSGSSYPELSTRSFGTPPSPPTLAPMLKAHRPKGAGLRPGG